MTLWQNLYLFENLGNEPKNMNGILADIKNILSMIQLQEKENVKSSITALNGA